MKKLMYIMCCLLFLATATSCNDFLDEVAKSSLTPENSFTNENDWNKTLTGAYAMLQEVFVQKYTIVLGEFGTDEVTPFDLGWAAYAELRNYTYSASHEFFQGSLYLLLRRNQTLQHGHRHARRSTGWCRSEDSDGCPGQVPACPLLF